MSNEISLTASLTVNKPSVMTTPVSKSVTGNLSSMGGNGYVEGVLNCSTAPTAIPLGGVTAPCQAWLRNLDPANTIYVGSGTVTTNSLYPIQLYPNGQPTILTFNAASTLYAVATPNAALLEYVIISV